MKRILLSFLLLVSVAGVYAQAERKYELRPEFTARGYVGFYNNGCRVSGGVNIDGKRSAGLMLGYHDSYHDDAPGDVYSIVTALYYRRYFPFGKHGGFAFYVDAYAGAGWVYKVDEVVPDGGESMIDQKAGDVEPVLGLQPGLRIRLYRNVHISLGPSIATDCVGVHFGVGF